MERKALLDLLSTIESIAFAARYLAASSLDAIVTATTASREVIKLSENKDEEAGITVAARLKQLIAKAHDEDVKETVADQDVAILVLLHHLVRFAPRRAEMFLAHVADEKALDWARKYAVKHRQAVECKSSVELLSNVATAPAWPVTNYARMIASDDVLVSYKSVTRERAAWSSKRRATAYYRKLKRVGLNQVSLYGRGGHTLSGKAS